MDFYVQLIALISPSFEPLPTNTENHIDLSDPELEEQIKEVDKIYYLFEPTVQSGELGRANPFKPLN